MKCGVHNFVHTAYFTQLATRCWVFGTWFSKFQVYVLVWFVMGGERKENDAEGKEIKSTFLPEALNDCYWYATS